MKRTLRVLSVLLVCMVMFLATACKITTYDTYQLTFYVAPIMQDNTIKEAQYDFEEMSDFIEKMKTDSAFIEDVVSAMEEKLDGEANGEYASLAERVCASADIGFTNQTNFSTNGTVKRTLINVQVAVVGDAAFRDALGEVMKVEAPKYIQATLSYPSDCIGTHCELISDQKGVYTQFGLGL